jgi:hypothetical protein
MRAVPYGIYDVGSNRGSVYVGTSADTPEFAVIALACWWEDEGRQRFPHAKKLLILADAGGSNGARSRSFKLQLQEQLSNRYGLSVSVCHYPTGCSKWNPIEHRLFSQISLNWAGKPLRSLDTMLNAIRGTTTQTGLTVRAAVLDGTFEKGQKVSDDQMQQLNIEYQSVCSQWNYTIRPQLTTLSETTQASTVPEVIFLGKERLQQAERQTPKGATLSHRRHPARLPIQKIPPQSLHLRMQPGEENGHQDSLAQVAWITTYGDIKMVIARLRNKDFHIRAIGAAFLPSEKPPKNTFNI